MAIDVNKLKAWPFKDIEQRYSERDTILYALGVGIGHDPMDTDALRYVYEDGLQALPTLAVVLGYPGFWAKDPATGIDWVKVLHGEQSLELHAPLPAAGTVIGKSRVTAIVDKGVKRISAAGYVDAARDDPPPFELEGYEPGTTLEGMLFPATYEVLPATKASEFVATQLATFDERFAGVDVSRAAKANLTEYDVVIIASMIEREAQVAAERPLVAAVIWNRLRKDMRLQIDATVQYALGKQKPELTWDDLKVRSPYNTYLHGGLPPTPIANPGLAALQAAADPAGVGYLYYVARNDGTGRHFFSSSYEQFLVDKAKANAQ